MGKETDEEQDDLASDEENLDDEQNAEDEDAEDDDDDDDDDDDGDIEALRAENKKLAKRLEGFEKEKRDRKAADRRRRREKAEKSGKTDEIVAHERELREEAETEATRVAAENAELKAERRTAKLAKKVAKAAGGGNVDALIRLLPTLDGIEAAPKVVTKSDVMAATKAIKDVAPELLGAPTTTKNGRPPARPGINRNLPDGEQDVPEKGTPEYWKHQGYIASRQTSVPPAYANATGRVKPKE